MATPFDAKDHFDKMSSSYEQLIGLATGDIARHAVSLIPPPTSNSVIHDNACGTGLATEALLAITSTSTPPAHPTIQATDLTPSMVSAIQRKASSNGWQNFTAQVMDAQALAFPDNTFDLSIMNFGIFFLPDPQKGADHIYRTLKPGGLAVVTSWKERRIFDTLQEAQKIIRPDLELWTSQWAKAWESEDTLRSALVKAGFGDENVRFEIKRTEAIVEPFLERPEVIVEGFPAAVKGWTDDERGRLGKTMLDVCQGLDGGVKNGLSMVARIAIARK
jgi:ubiquinone/menaquinone biosynthesis C-methylase UbiE